MTGRWTRGATRHTPHPPHVMSHPIAPRRRHLVRGLSQHVTAHDLTSHRTPLQEVCSLPVDHSSVLHHTSSPHVTSHPIAPRRRHIVGGLSQHVTPHDLTSHHPFQERCQSQVGGPGGAGHAHHTHVTSHPIRSSVAIPSAAMPSHHATSHNVTSQSGTHLGGSKRSQRMTSPHTTLRAVTWQPFCSRCTITSHNRT